MLANLIVWLSLLWMKIEKQGLVAAIVINLDLLPPTLDMVTGQGPRLCGYRLAGSTGRVQEGYGGA